MRRAMLYSLVATGYTGDLVACVEQRCAMAEALIAQQDWLDTEPGEGEEREIYYAMRNSLVVMASELDGAGFDSWRMREAVKNALQAAKRSRYYQEGV